ncbi:hypothetical protein L0Y49_03245, partial [bacterium]|nr:hypothetical protein [bacterium]
SKKQEARDVMIYGIVGIFVIISIWAIVAFFQSSFGINQAPVTPRPPDLPTLPGGKGDIGGSGGGSIFIPPTPSGPAPITPSPSGPAPAPPLPPPPVVP